MCVIDRHMSRGNRSVVLSARAGLCVGSACTVTQAPNACFAAVHMQAWGSPDGWLGAHSFDTAEGGECADPKRRRSAETVPRGGAHMQSGRRVRSFDM